MKKVIVTGGAGFLGSTLVPELVKAGYEVHVIDDLSAGKKERIPAEATLHEIDIRNEEALNKCFESLGDIYGVFHLAALPRVQFSIDHPKEAHSVNIDGLLNVFNAAAKYKARRLVYSASSSAYGNQEVLPLHEGLVPSPMSPYAAQKYYGEIMARNYALHFGLPTVCLRYFNLFGPNYDPKGAYPQAIGLFLYLKSQGKPLTVTGDGLQTRDCVFVTDVARANILALESEKVGKGEVMNIGSGTNPTILDIANEIGGEIVHIPPRIEPRNTKADISRAKELIGWEPKVSFKEGIAILKKLAGIE
ncbi:MAG: NAD-dependent epimerase/dehydratase family protein [Candidatus Paceibacterota bacterium]|jgi:UDP-glucose 4-epimerase